LQDFASACPIPSRPWPRGNQQRSLVLEALTVNLDYVRSDFFRKPSAQRELFGTRRRRVPQRGFGLQTQTETVVDAGADFAGEGDDVAALVLGDDFYAGGGEGFEEPELAATIINMTTAPATSQPITRRFRLLISSTRFLASASDFHLARMPAR